MIAKKYDFIGRDNEYSHIKFVHVVLYVAAMEFSRGEEKSLEFGRCYSKLLPGGGLHHFSDTADVDTNMQDKADGVGTVSYFVDLRRELFRGIKMDVTVWSRSHFLFRKQQIRLDRVLAVSEAQMVVD